MRLILTAVFCGSLLGLQAQFACQDLKNMDAVSMSSFAGNQRSDSLDILHYHLELDLQNIPNRQLSGMAEITFTPKLSNISELPLDLLQLQTDSVLMNNNSLSFTHQGELVRINLGGSYQSGDTLTLKVYYSGSPKVDNSGWGGFHTQSGYYFNLGVGFAADPHVYGRAWFPCFDNFVERATFSFSVKTQAAHRAYCNGLQTTDTVLPAGYRLSQWEMSQAIPSYLASVAVSNYTDTSWTFQAASQNIPVQLIARPGDMANVLSAFTHLDSNLSGFIRHFGPYRWQKVGYAMTTLGAMEHATSIHFPISLISQGQAAAEDIMAHELAHHWFGNLITCETADDMWINEGMAEFCSHLFYEDIYGRPRYLQEVRHNAYNVINNAHRQDGAYYPIYGLPHNLVYGYHVYQKGAMVAHNLRARLGDALFFSSLTQLLDNMAFRHIGTADFRDQLSQLSNINLQEFFQGWVFEEGFPSIALDSLWVNGNSAHVRLRQRLHRAPALFNDLPLSLTFFSAKGDTVHRDVVMSGARADFSFPQLPFSPAFVLPTYSAKLLTADTYDEFLLTFPRSHPEKYGKMRVELKNTLDSSRIIVTHHYAGPGGKLAPGSNFRLSGERYWTVRGFGLDSADITGVVKYDGTANGYDGDLLQHTEDSLMILYRPDATFAWMPYPRQQKFGASGVFNKLGSIEIQQMMPGEYVLANAALPFHTSEITAPRGISIYPNPASEEIKVHIKQAQAEDVLIEVNDAAGRLLFIRKLNAPVSEQEISIPLPPRGNMLWVRINGYAEKVLIRP